MQIFEKDRCMLMFQFSDNDIAIVQSLDHSADGIASRVAQSAQEGGAQSQEGTQAVRLLYFSIFQQI